MTAVQRPPNGILPIGRKVSEESIDKHLDWLIDGSNKQNDRVFSNEDKMDYDQRQNEKNFGDDNGRTWNSPDDSSDPIERAPSRGGEDDSFDEYDFTDDQRQALLELDNMKLDLGYTIDEDPPEYDVTERVRQLNEELANDPTPIDDDRERSIKFKDNLIDFMAPPPDYSDDESHNRDGEDEASSDYMDTPHAYVVNGYSDLDHEQSQNEPASSQDHSDAQNAAAKSDKQEDLNDKHNDNDYDYDIDRGHPESTNDEVDYKSMSSLSESGDGQAKLQLKQDRDEPLPDYDYEEAVADDDEPEPNTNQNGNPSDKHNGSDESLANTENKGAFLTDGGKVGGASSIDSKNEEKVLVERDGKYELVSAAELKAQGMYPFPMADEEETTDHVDSDRTDQSRSSEKSSPNSTVPSDMSPRPPRHPRPVTAVTRRAPQNSRRVKSAQIQHQERDVGVFDEFTYTSPYALSPEEKEELRKKHRHDERQKKVQEEKQKKEEEERRKMNNETFEAWLAQKRRDAVTNRREQANRTKEQKQEDDKAKQGFSRSSSLQDSTSTLSDQDQGAFDEWMKMKRKQAKEDQKVERAKQKEVEEGWYTRPRNECNKAFKEWLKKKNAEKKNTSKEDRQKQRVSRLMLRRTRKAMALARALRQSQSFRYVDYYGYRY